MMDGKRLSVAVGLAVSLAAFGSLVVGGAGQVLGGRQGVFRYLEQYEKGRQRGALLEERGRAVRGRMEAKEQVIEALLDGRLRLDEAARHFLVLNRTPEEFPATYPLGDWPTGTADERICRQVIGWAVTSRRFRGLPESAEAQRLDLVDELEALRGPDGGVKLPE